MRDVPRTSSSVAIDVNSDSNNEAPFVGDGDGAPEAQHVHLDQVNMPTPTPVVEGLSLRVMRRTESSIGINISEAPLQRLPEFFVGPDDENFKGLVKDRRFDCYRSLGGSEGIVPALASSYGGIGGDGPDLQRRREFFGVNKYPKRKTKSLWSHFWDAVRDVFLLVLLVCAALSLGFGIKEHGVKDGWYDGVGIFVSVFLIAAMSAVGNRCHAKLFDQLCRDSESDNNPVTVRRGGQDLHVLTSEVVVGDVVKLKIGDVVPADGVVIQSCYLEVMKSTKLPPVALHDKREPFCPAGAKVTNGRGMILVTAVGKDTDCGEWMSRSITIRRTQPTPLQMRLDGLKSKISNVRNAIAMLTALHSTGDTGDVTTKVARVFQHALAIVVSAIPEALPLAVSLTLAFCTKRMLKERALMQHLSDCETLGSVTAVCVDIRGLLAADQMKVTESWVDTNTTDEAATIASDVRYLLYQGICFANTSFETIEQSALLSWAGTALGRQDLGTYKVLPSEDFTGGYFGAVTLDSARHVTLAHFSGAADVILASCCRYLSADGEEHDLRVEKRTEFEKIISDMKQANLSSFALALKEVECPRLVIDGVECLAMKREMMRDLTLLSLLGLKALCRPEAKVAIEACATAGISIKMVTCCTTTTAQAVAQECGIISGDDDTGVLIEGHVFRKISPDDQLESVDKIRVMALSHPNDRLLLVQLLNDRGHLVAGIAGGTDEVPLRYLEPTGRLPDVVMDIDTVVRAIGWGRCVYTNTQKIIQFQLTFNMAAVVVNLASAVIKGKVLLTSVQLLWVTLIIDTMGALALASDTPPLKELMRRPPIRRTAPLISNAMWRDLTAQAVFHVAVLLAIAYGGHHFFDTSVNAMVFNAFVLCQVFNEFNARQMEQKNIFAGFRPNMMFLAVIAATLALQVLMVEVLAKFVGTQRLSWAQWVVCGVIAVMSWPIEWVVKFIPVPDKPFDEILPEFRFGFYSR